MTSGAPAPTISRGQVWVNNESGERVTVADFAEYTAGWFVRVEEGHVFHEPLFRAGYTLVVNGDDDETQAARFSGDVRGTPREPVTSGAIENEPSYPMTPVDCLISELRELFFPVLSKTSVMTLDAFEKRVAQFNKEVGRCV